MDDLSIYIHIPFCTRRCGYCDFNTYAGLDHLFAEYVDAVCTEIDYFSNVCEEFGYTGIGSIYFGGGTPSLLPPHLLAKILESSTQIGDFLGDLEVTMEVNPGTVDRDYLSAVYAMGIKRLSIGVQSARQNELKLLDRLHGYEHAVGVVADARQVGFENISLDLIYGLPDQEVEQWAKSLIAAMSLEPEHLSLYALSVEPGTPLEAKVNQNIYPKPDEDLTAEMYEYAVDMLAKNGFTHYEISNWARKNADGELLVSNHNRQYWLNNPYLGIGAGAHGFVGGFRTMNERFPQKYIQMLKDGTNVQFPRTPATDDVEEIDSYREMQETIFMGLRLLEEGVSEKRFDRRFGVSYWDVFASEFQGLIDKGLLVVDQVNGDERIKMSPNGVFISNQIFVEFV